MRPNVDPAFDRHVTELLRVSTRNTAKYPGDPDWTDETWERKVKVLATLIYRAGAQAGLSHQFGRLDTAIERVRWLVEHDLASVDVSELLSEVENLQEVDRSLMGNYGVTDGAIRSMIAEGLHTAFRKASDSPESLVIHRLIDGMPHEEWRGITDFVAGPLITMLREAEDAAKTEDQEDTT